MERIIHQHHRRLSLPSPLFPIPHWDLKEKKDDELFIAFSDDMLMKRSWPTIRTPFSGNPWASTFYLPPPPPAVYTRFFAYTLEAFVY